MQNRVHDLLRTTSSRRGDQLALIDPDDNEFSWNDVQLMAMAAAKCLTSHGVQPGDRVVIVFENSVEAIAFFFGCSLVDASAVMINARMTRSELDRVFDHSDTSLIVFTSRSSNDARVHSKWYGAAFIEGGFGSVSVLVRTGSLSEEVYKDGTRQVALLLYTSGTTGAPKAAMLTHANLIAGAKSSAHVREAVPTDITYLALPLSHIFGLVTLLAITLSESAFRLEAKFSVDRLYAALKRDVTLLPAVPQVHALLFEYARSHGPLSKKTSSLRFVSSGGAPLDRAWKSEAETFYGLPLQNGYGLTESSGAVCATMNEMADPDISVGRPVLDNVVRLDMDAPGASPEAGIGEIILSGPQITIGYFRDPGQTAMAFTPEGFFRTGDLGRFDDSQCLHIVGRSKELIIRSGFNVYPPEIEATLIEHSDVVVAAVIGRPVKGNEEIIAFVAVHERSQITEIDLKAYVKERLSPYKQPARVIVAKALPTALTGKILKAKLLETFADELST